MTNKHLFLLGLIFLLLILLGGCSSTTKTTSTVETTTIEPVEIPKIIAQIELPKVDKSDMPIDILEVYEGEDVQVNDDVKGNFTVKIKQKKDGKKVAQIDMKIEQKPIEAKVVKKVEKIDKLEETKGLDYYFKILIYLLFGFIIAIVVIYLVRASQGKL